MRVMNASHLLDHAILFLYRISAYAALNLADDAALLALMFC